MPPPDPAPPDIEHADRVGLRTSVDDRSTNNERATPVTNPPPDGNPPPDRPASSEVPRLPQLYLTNPPRPVTDEDWEGLVGGTAHGITLPLERDDRHVDEATPGAATATTMPGRWAAVTREIRDRVRTIAERPLFYAVLAIVAVAAVSVGWLMLGGGAAGPTGSLTVTSRPAGARFLIDGEPRGTTPATIGLSAGSHVLQLDSDGPTQVLEIQVENDRQVSRYFELGTGTAPARLAVRTKPAGASVSVDGRLRGKSPLVIEDLNPGPHRVRVTRETQSLERAVMMEPGATGSLDLFFDAADAPVPAGHGLLAVSIPVEIRASERGKPIGTTQATPWQLPAGQHELELVNDLLGVRLVRQVEIRDGLVHGLEVEIAPGALSVTTSPEARVLIDGEPLGSAVARYPVTAGQHDVIARHPTLGDRRLLVTVLPGGAVSVNVDFAPAPLPRD
jgi:hypothetical protein